MKYFYYLLGIICVLTIYSFSNQTSKENFFGECPICNSHQYKTGETKIEYSKIVYEVKCGLGHSFWLPGSEIHKKEKKSNEKPQKETCKCPICGHTGYNTSKHKVKKCLNGHEFGC